MQSSSETLTRELALRRFTQLGYTIIDGSQEEHGSCSSTGRSDTSVVVLPTELRQALRSLNPDCTNEQIEVAFSALTENRSLSSLAQANEQIYNLLRDGIKIDVRGQLIEDDNGSIVQERPVTHKTLQVINWREPLQNSFTVVSHFWLSGQLGKRCLNLVVFVNGLPFVLLEIACCELPNTFDRIDRDYKTTLPAFFWYNAFIVVADAFTGKMGSLTTPWEHFFHWKRVHDEREPESTKLDTLIEGTCDKSRLLDIVENFTIFDRSKGLNKLVARNHQYLGVNNAIASLKALEEQRAARRLAGLPEPLKDHGKLGVFWHTQGSGKSYSMVFFVRKVQRTIDNGYTFVVITDRKDLDRQIFDNFRYAGTISEDPKEIHARNAKHLKRLLGERHLLLFTLIQKFYSENNDAARDYEVLSDREKIIVIVDEAHRTQYDRLAKNMRDALPRAAFIGFTGTPLMDGEEQTRETFGRYVSIYNFRRAINDGVTVRLYHENSTPQVEMVNDNFHDEMARLLEDAMLDERQEQKVVEQYARLENIFTDPQRLDQVAEHIVWHFMNRGYMGKAMVVSIDKLTAVRTYNRVRAYWRRYREDLGARLQRESDPEIRLELEHKIAYMEETDMAVVVSVSESGAMREDGTRSEGDVERFERFSRETGERVEIIPHHQRFRDEDLAEKFKDPGDTLRIVFVCAMWMTGFDVPCLSTIYLDRPLEGHTLMQTIARANRVYKDKPAGTIVDYSGSQRALTKALAIYAREDTSGYQEGDRPIGDKTELVQALREKLAETERFCQEQGIDMQDLKTKFAAAPDRRSRMHLLQPAIDTLVAYEGLKLTALLLISEVSKLYKAILPDAAEKDFTLPVHLFELLKSGIYAAMSVSGVNYVIRRAKNLVRASLEVQERDDDRLNADTLTPTGQFDILAVDTAALDADLRTGHRHIKAEQIRNQLIEQIRRLIYGNPTRVQHMEKLQRVVDRYNEGCANIASDPPLLNPQEKITPHPAIQAERERLENEYIEGLVEIAGEVAQEARRSELEGLSEEQLAVFDLLALNVSLNPEEHAQVKALACALLAELAPTFAIPDWQKKSQTLNRARIIIEDHISRLPQPYDEAMRGQKIEALFIHIQEHFKNDGSSVA